MSSLLTAFIASLFLTFLIIHSRLSHENHSGDMADAGIQKLHLVTIPRVGGIGIFFGLIAGLTLHIISTPYESITWQLPLIASIPFAIGLSEDISKKVGVRIRLMAVAISACLASYFLDLKISSIDIAGIDYLLSFPGLTIAITVFAITGLTNSYNIIDGLNGLSSMTGMLAASCLAYLAYRLGDTTLLFLSLVLLAAILGFFILNYPRGHIFLGDGGAYLIGFWIAILSICLSYKHTQVSPWFALLINAYPVTETLFTIYRRSFYKNSSAMDADRLHLHSLIYRRILHSHALKTENKFIGKNSKAAPYLWIINLITLVPAILWWDKTGMLIGAFIIYFTVYLWLYKKIISFQTPKWLLFK
ncbi:MraY family glycosyltransferase [Polynucleobacter asymbioticus]|uniref:Glycosyl transferase, family 4 n=1 Tax=Polynucleobacter asymbioticus (strain DSM 18221 / CIP 109841 / QLW-P1DMWA-1) TaxID=312153 RepID=A4SVM3_POLAQ|nr:glycosyltransferase [Polynucleobacter asymbioticus]ABP33537.1 glycosyl transferase, family 4 [Polynucleobacter asymbioticus QLW-P1DMWA-1]